MSGQKINMFMLLTIIGIYILSQQSKKNIDEGFSQKTALIENFKYEGVIMMICAAFTEALIYFIVREIKTNNNWNHLFISYSFGALILTIYYFKDIYLYNIETFCS
jgi:hypothetical protein